MKENESMQDEYDFSNSRKGEYAARYQKGSNVVVLDPDVAKVFNNREFVNSSLRALAQVLEDSKTKTL